MEGEGAFGLLWAAQGAPYHKACRTVGELRHSSGTFPLWTGIELASSAQAVTAKAIPAIGMGGVLSIPEWV